MGLFNRDSTPKVKPKILCSGCSKDITEEDDFECSNCEKIFCLNCMSDYEDANYCKKCKINLTEYKVKIYTNDTSEWTVYKNKTLEEAKKLVQNIQDRISSKEEFLEFEELNDIDFIRSNNIVGISIIETVVGEDEVENIEEEEM